MKRIYIPIIIATIFALYSCTTDNKDYIAKDYKAPIVTTPSAGTNIILSENQPEDSLKVRWQPADYGFPGAIVYLVQMAPTSTDFKEPIKIAEVKATEAAIAPDGLNNSLLIAGAVPNTPISMEIRVSAFINNYIATVASSPIVVTMTAYDKKVVYPLLFMPGSYQGWNPADSLTAVYSIKSDGIYEGYFKFQAGTKFKFTQQPDWNPINWGGANGTLIPGGSDIEVANEGIFRVIADINAQTYNLTPTLWSIYGSATANTDVPMTFDPITRIFTATTTLSAGDFIFRANATNALQLGVYYDNQLKYSGNAIAITTPETYTITLNFSKYPYTFTLQD